MAQHDQEQKKDAPMNTYRVLVCGRQMMLKAQSAQAALHDAVSRVAADWLEECAVSGEPTFSVSRVEYHARVR